jgi:hypothetical protein
MTYTNLGIHLQLYNREAQEWRNDIKKWNNLRDCIAEKGIDFFWLCRIKGKRFGKLGLLCGWEKRESLITSCVC